MIVLISSAVGLLISFFFFFIAYHNLKNMCVQQLQHLIACYMFYCLYALQYGSVNYPINPVLEQAASSITHGAHVLWSFTAAKVQRLNACLTCCTFSYTAASGKNPTACHVTN